MRHISEAEQIASGAGLKTSESISVVVDLGESRKRGADLIVVGSHGRRGISRFALGSVSEAVATHATFSVEVIQ